MKNIKYDRWCQGICCKIEKNYPRSLLLLPNDQNYSQKRRLTYSLVNYSMKILPVELHDKILLPAFYYKNDLTIDEKIGLFCQKQYLNNVVSQLRYLNNEFEYLRIQPLNHWHFCKKFYYYAICKNNQKNFASKTGNPRAIFAPKDKRSSCYKQVPWLPL